MDFFNHFELERAKYQPLLPDALFNIAHIEPNFADLMPAKGEIAPFFVETGNQSLVTFKKGQRNNQSCLRVGVVFSGGQAPGGHNIIAGLLDSLKKINPTSQLFGFLEGPSGIIENQFIELTEETIAPFRNSGGFDLIGSGRTKIEKKEDLQKALEHCQKLNLNGLVVIGGDDSNTNAAFLAEYFCIHRSLTHIVGLPKTIDGDLKNQFIETPFGFDTACKVYSEMIGNICRDCKSAKKYTHFIKLMGRSASHIALECALQTHPNLTLIGEEIAAQKMTLEDIAEKIAQLVISRASQGKHYGVILIPEGLIEFIVEIKTLIEELNRLKPQQVPMELTLESRKVFSFLPKEVAHQLLIDRDPHGNIQVSQIATEKLLIELVQKNLARKHFSGKFSPLAHFLGYEGRCSYPSNFDANYCYALGFTATALISCKLNGYMGTLHQLSLPTSSWIPQGIPLSSMLDFEQRKGMQKIVIKKALVDLSASPFQILKACRTKWAVEDHYRYPGPIQFFGSPELCDRVTFTLDLLRN